MKKFSNKNLLVILLALSSVLFFTEVYSIALPGSEEVECECEEMECGGGSESMSMQTFMEEEPVKRCLKCKAGFVEGTAECEDSWPVICCTIFSFDALCCETSVGNHCTWKFPPFHKEAKCGAEN